MIHRTKSVINYKSIKPLFLRIRTTICWRLFNEKQENICAFFSVMFVCLCFLIGNFLGLFSFWLLFFHGKIFSLFQKITATKRDGIVFLQPFTAWIEPCKVPSVTLLIAMWLTGLWLSCSRNGIFFSVFR